MANGEMKRENIVGAVGVVLLVVGLCFDTLYGPTSKIGLGDAGVMLLGAVFIYLDMRMKVLRERRVKNP